MTIFARRLKNRLSPAQKQALAHALRRFLCFVPHKNNLSLLALEHGTTKWGNGYMPYYQTHFAPFRNRALKLLEIGVGGYQDPRSGGESLRMWKDYFPRGMIYGIDVVDKSYHNDDRITTFVGSQNDPIFLDDLARRLGQFDIIIDDGSHVSDHVITAFRTLFPRLADNGVYVIEDLSWSYWPQRGGDWRDARKATSVTMLKDLVNGVNHQFIPHHVSSYTDLNIISLHFYPQIAFIVKGKNQQELPGYILEEINRAKSYNT
jgi:hypothetical protein